MKKRKTSIVTGGAGFIGSNLVDQLVRMGHGQEPPEHTVQFLVFFWHKN